MSDNQEIRFARLERAPAYKNVSEAILKDIIDGRLTVGNRLPSELKLAEQFGVHRSTVREGIRLLEETGVLRREFGKRLVVSRPSYGSVGNQISRAMILHEVTFRDLWETIMVIEPAAAALAARRRTAEDLDRIADNIARTRAALNDKKAIVALDIEFHSLVAQACANRAIVLAREALTSFFIQPSRRYSQGSRWRARGSSPRMRRLLRRSRTRTLRPPANGWSVTSTTSARATKCRASTSTVRWRRRPRKNNKLRAPALPACGGPPRSGPAASKLLG
jgi:GntR family transcriptional repressor for pyruvate dehydrogenase complex